MSEIITLAGTFKNQKELQTYCNAAYTALKASAEKIKQLEEENVKLRELVATPKENKVEVIIESPELAICNAQIDMLKMRALTKELTLEETKQLDLLIKNKRLLSGDPTTIEGEKKKPKRQYTDAELVLIAQKDDKQ
jgi:hypothetical protein